MRRLPPDLKLALDEYADQLRRSFGERLKELRLFGSYARGEAHEESDVDVLVLVDGLTELERGVVAGEAAPIIHRTGLPLAPLPMSVQHFEALRLQGRALASELVKDGVVL